MPKTTQILRRQLHRGRRPAPARTGCRWLGIFLAAGLAGLVVLLVVLWGVGTTVYQTITADLPAYADLSRLDDAAQTPPSQILAWSDASQQQTIVIDEIVDPLNGQRHWLTLDQIPADVINATIAAGEPDFWTSRFSLWTVGQQFITFTTGNGAEPVGDGRGRH